MLGDVDAHFTKTPLLFPAGFSGGHVASGDRVVPARSFAVRPGHRLADWTEEYTLVTPAAIFLAIPWPVGPLEAFANDTGTDPGVRLMWSEHPLFRGLPPEWLHHLWCLPNDVAEDVIGYLGTLAVQGPDEVYRVRTQTIHAIEPWEQDRTRLYTPVEALVVDGSEGCHYFVQQRDDASGIVWSKFLYDPDLVFDDTQRFWSAIEKAQNPYEEKGFFDDAT